MPMASQVVVESPINNAQYVQETCTKKSTYILCVITHTATSPMPCVLNGVPSNGLKSRDHGKDLRFGTHSCIILYVILKKLRV